MDKEKLIMMLLGSDDANTSVNTPVIDNNDKVVDIDTPAKKTIFDNYIGRYVIVRTRNEGVNAGKVLQADETGVVVEDARRLWSHRPADRNLSWYEGVAESGLGSDYRISNPVTKIIVEDYSLTLCTKEAEDNIRSATTNKQS